jgi:hypothetical protein
MSTDGSMDNLSLEGSRQDKAVDLTVAGFVGLVGLTPIIGSLIAEVVSEIIPRRREARIISMLEKLSEKVIGLESEFEVKLRTPEYVALLEDGFIQSSKSLTAERLDYIASLLKNSIPEEDNEHIWHQKLLSILGDLNDAQVIILKRYSFHSADVEGIQSFIQQHQDILRVPTIVMGASDEDVEHLTRYNVYRDGLVSVNLLEPKYKKLSKSELPEFDYRTGRIETSGYQITRLGRALLEFIDQE